MNPSEYPARVARATAMRILAITDDKVFRKVVDANPQVVHRIAGEVRAKYLTAELFRLLK